MNKQLLERVYPDDWSVVPLVKFAENSATSFVDGPFGSDLKVSDYTEVGVRVLQLQNLGDGNFKDDNKVYTSESKAKQLSRCITKPGDIAIAKMAEPLARAVIVPDLEDKYLIVADLIKLRSDNEVDSNYIVSFINFDDFRVEAERLSTGTTRTRISLSTLKSISLPKPPLKQQQKIVKILTTVDNLIEKTQALIDKYTAIKQGMMADLFTRGIDLSGTPETNPNYGQLRPSFEDAPELYQETELGWVPKEWEVVSLGNHITKIDSGWSPVCGSEQAESDEWAVLKTTAVIWEGYDHSENKKLPVELDGEEKIEVKRDDLLVTRKGPVDRVGVAVHVYETRDKLMFPDTVFRFRVLKEEALSPAYLAISLQSRSVQLQWDARKIGLAEAQVNINHSIVRSTKFVLPSKVEQKSITTKLNNISRLIIGLSRSVEKYRSIKKGQMQDLLTGKVKVN